MLWTIVVILVVVVRADEKLAAFVELEWATRADQRLAAALR